MKNVSNKYDNSKAKLTEIISEQEYVCLTTDVWSSRAQSYLGVTLHFLTPTLERIPVMLAFRQLREKQTYIVLAEAMCRIMEDFRIPVKKVTNIVTDGGSAFCKAFKEFGCEVGALIEENENIDEEDEVHLSNNDNLSRIRFEVFI